MALSPALDNCPLHPSWEQPEHPSDTRQKARCGVPPPGTAPRGPWGAEETGPCPWTSKEKPQVEPGAGRGNHPESLCLSPPGSRGLRLPATGEP